MPPNRFPKYLAFCISSWGNLLLRGSWDVTGFDLFIFPLHWKIGRGKGLSITPSSLLAEEGPTAIGLLVVACSNFESDMGRILHTAYVDDTQISISLSMCQTSICSDKNVSTWHLFTWHLFFLTMQDVWMYLQYYHENWKQITYMHNYTYIYLYTQSVAWTLSRSKCARRRKWATTRNDFAFRSSTVWGSEDVRELVGPCGSRFSHGFEWVETVLFRFNVVWRSGLLFGRFDFLLHLDDDELLYPEAKLNKLVQLQSHQPSQPCMKNFLIFWHVFWIAVVREI